jgi:hypothetical protein
MGERIADRIGYDPNLILISIHYVTACCERRRVPSTMFTAELGF